MVVTVKFHKIMVKHYLTPDVICNFLVDSNRQSQLPFFIKYIKFSRPLYLNKWFRHLFIGIRIKVLSCPSHSKIRRLIFSWWHAHSPYLWSRVTRGMAGHPEALSEAHSKPPGLKLHQWWDTHKAIEGDLHKAEVGEARRLGADQPTFGRAEEPLALLINPAPQPVESTVTAPWVVCSRAEDRRLGWMLKLSRSKTENNCQLSLTEFSSWQSLMSVHEHVCQ